MMNSTLKNSYGAIQLVNEMSDAFLSPLYANVNVFSTKILPGDVLQAESFKCNRAVLAAASPVLKSILLASPELDDELNIHLDCSETTLRDVLRICYGIYPLEKTPDLYGWLVFLKIKYIIPSCNICMGEFDLNEDNKCSYCNFSLERMRNMNMNNIKINLKVDFDIFENDDVCRSCKKLYDSPQKLNEHFFDHHYKQIFENELNNKVSNRCKFISPFEMDPCHKKFVNKQMLIRHIALDHKVLENALNKFVLQSEKKASKTNSKTNQKNSKPNQTKSKKSSNVPLNENKSGIVCSKCLKSFPSKEISRLHTCDSLLDKSCIANDAEKRPHKASIVENITDHVKKGKKRRKSGDQGASKIMKIQEIPPKNVPLKIFHGSNVSQMKDSHFLSTSSAQDKTIKTINISQPLQKIEENINEEFNSSKGEPSKTSQSNKDPVERSIDCINIETDYINEPNSGDQMIVIDSLEPITEEFSEENISSSKEIIVSVENVLNSSVFKSPNKSSSYQPGPKSSKIAKNSINNSSLDEKANESQTQTKITESSAQITPKDVKKGISCYIPVNPTKTPIDQPLKVEPIKKPGPKSAKVNTTNVEKNNAEKITSTPINSSTPRNKPGPRCSKLNITPGPKLSSIANTTTLSSKANTTPGPKLSSVAKAIPSSSKANTTPGPKLSSIAKTTPSSSKPNTAPGPKFSSIAKTTPSSSKTNTTPGPKLSSIANTTTSSTPGPKLSSIAKTTTSSSKTNTNPGPKLSSNAKTTTSSSKANTTPGPKLSSVTATNTVTPKRAPKPEICKVCNEVFANFKLWMEHVSETEHFNDE